MFIVFPFANVKKCLLSDYAAQHRGFSIPIPPSHECRRNVPSDFVQV